jgi:8-oxo-dGTP diphosphatase
MSDPRPVIEVACGVLQDRLGRVLLAQRPEGKIAAGYWEFPGGKVEPGETVRDALARELAEELGVKVTAARPLIRLRHAYSNRIVLLDTWLVTGFDGEPLSREGQALSWRALDRIEDLQTLPTVAPILRPLRLPADYVFTPADATLASIRAGLERLPHRALLRLRLPELGDAGYAALARDLVAETRERGLRLVLDREPALSRELACGFHAASAVWPGLTARPVPEHLPFIASAHSQQDLRQLAEAGAPADAAVLGHVQPTTTHPQDPELGWAGFRDAIYECGLPVYAIGGVGPADHDRIWTMGGQGSAGIRAYWS